MDEGITHQDTPLFEQSQFTKENLYNLDSDDDELDFLKESQGFDINLRNQMRTEHKAKVKKDLFQNYDRKYPVVKFDEPKLETVERGNSDYTY